MGKLDVVIRVRQAFASGEARRLRLAAGATLAECAAEVGSTPTTVSRWELGARCPGTAAALRYATVLSRLERAAGATTAEAS